MASISEHEQVSVHEQDSSPTYMIKPNILSCQAELVLMMLRWLPEDITVHNEDLEGL